MFGKNKFPAVAALAGLSGAALTAELVSAANDELEAQGILGAALVTRAAHEQLTTDATAWNAALEALEAAEATDVAALATDRDSWKEKAESFGEQPGKLPTSSQKQKADVAEEGGDENERIVAETNARMLGEG